MRTASASAKPCQGDSLEFYLITGNFLAVVALSRGQVEANYRHASYFDRIVFKDQFDSIKRTCVRTTEQSDSLIDKLNLKCTENEDLKAQIQDKVFVITSLKNDLQKIKGKEIVDIAVQIRSANTLVPGMFRLDLEPLAPSAKKVVVTPKNNVKKVRLAKPLTSSSNIKQVESSTTSDSNTLVLPATSSAELHSPNLSQEPKSFKTARPEPSWINAMQEGILEFQRLKVGELVTCPDKVLLIKLKWIYKVKTDEFGGESPSHVYSLKKAIYGLKQAPRAWYDMLSSLLISQHLFKGAVDPTLFTTD
ncbi:hypothetical protein Tco_1012960 [Tanacetum coccineum]